MLIRYTDFNKADKYINENFLAEWGQISSTLENMSLHLKASDQAGIKGNPIFDPIGTNEYIKAKLSALQWDCNIRIPDKYSFLGTDIDYGKNGLIVEVQFSNYPFLLNNVLRSELFYKAKLQIATKTASMVVVVTKAHMFPASNSTLYYEQAKNQLTSLSDNSVFDVPIRLVGLFEKVDGGAVETVWSKYHTSRYSRTLSKRGKRLAFIKTTTREGSRCKIDFSLNPSKRANPKKD